MTRMAAVIRLRPETAGEYERLHAAVWPEVLATIAACHIRNYSIFLRRPEMLLFATWEYHGTDWAADVARMKADPATQRWWRLTDPCQDPLPTRAAGEWWAGMAEVFHTD
ncbi:MAG TPA: L-rhamnose mutarotase [Acetobacteraceae bacterium]|nr:L-rhamnose mutarotase [Acetobacteraceae bacterium]